MNEKTHIALPQEFVNSVFAYLAKKPFEEVAAFFAAIEKVGTPVEDPKKAAQGQD